MHLLIPSPAGRLLLALLWLLAGPAAWAQAPTLTTVSPRGALVGDQVTLTGTGFTGTTGLTLAGAAVPGYTIISDTQIRFNVPVGAASGLLTVTRPAGTSNGRPLEVGELRSLAVSGFTDDVVANGTGMTATASTSTTFDASADVLHELGYNNGSATAATGLPVGGFFVGAASGSTYYNVPPSQQYTNAVPYQLASYAASNSLRLPSTGPGSGTLALATPTAAAQLFVLTASANGGSAVDVTVTFTDNTTQTFAGLSVDDWGAGPRPALAGVGRTARATSAISAVATDPRLFQLELRLAAANQGKLVQQVSISKTTAGSVLNVLALSYRLRLVPSITGFTPTNGPAGTAVTVTGTNLTSVQQVRVNGVRGTLTGTPTAGSFTFVVGAGSTTGPLTLDTFNGTATSSTSFTVPAALFVTGLSPARHQRNAPASSPVDLTFNQALRNDAATRGSLKVFSQQRGGRMQDGAGGSTTVSGSTLSFNPTTDFRPGETVFSTLTPAARNSANALSPTAGHVSQFTVAAGGTGRGGLIYASQAALGGSPNSGAAADVAVGDVDGDGDLDAVAVTNTATGQVLLNDGSGVFSAGSTVALTNSQRQVELADMDGDGDLDLLVLSLPDDTVFPSGAGTFSIRLNNGSGTFGGGQALALARGASSLAVGDVDGDGDLDAALLTPAVNGPCELRICLNTNGTLALGAAQAVSGSGYALVLADLDNDGDLDIATGGPSSTQGLLVLWNGGDASGSNTGTFSNPLLADAGAVTSASCIKAADLDNDGDLDLVLQGYISGTAVALNGGDNTGASVGTFGPGGSRPIGIGSFGGYLSIGDVDADGDLDVVTAANGVQNGLVLNRNGGNTTGTNAGQFTTGTGFSFISGAGQVRLTFATRLADMDGDGDLDLVAASTTQVGVWLNQPLPILTTASPNPVAAGGTLIVTGQYLTGTTAVRIRGGSNYAASFTVDSDTQLTAVVPAGVLAGPYALTVNTPRGLSNELTLTVVPPAILTAVSPAAELPGLPVELTGTGFTSTTAVSFGGVPAGSVVLNSATSITAVVPAGVPVGSAPAVLSYAGASSNQPFAALEVYNGGTLGSCEAAVPATATVADGAWHYLLSSGGQVVAAYNYTGPSLGDFAVDALRANPAQPVRQTPNGSRYLDRNWHLTASGGAFAGRTVQLRLYGLASELTRLRAADAAATPAALRALQYSGANEDCGLSNNAAPGERRLLPAPASVPSGAGWFASELTVADHFSEFYLTAASTPLPVELTSFTANAEGTAAVRLAWATASEKNSRAFEVERSANGQQFARIGEQPAQGTTASPSRYTFLDQQPLAGTSYYRLRQLDQDGTFAYSPVRTVTHSAVATGLTLFPNPAHGAATLTGTLPGTKVTVVDALGRPVATAAADATGTAALALPAGLPAGVYVVRAGATAVRLTVE